MNLVVRGTGETNELARFATLRAMTSDLSFQIDRYIDWTPDWSLSPNGHYYANKPPGTMFLAAPLFFILDHSAKLIESFEPEKHRNAQGIRIAPGPSVRIATSVILQLIPFAILVFLAANFMQSIGVSAIAIHFTTLSLLFGNTASIFMNSLFGHGVTAIFSLLALLTLLKRRYYLMGFSLGFAVLNEYFSIILLPLFFIGLFMQEKKDLRRFLEPVIGGLFPLALWIWYHVVAFGSPLKVTNHYQNPIFQIVAKDGAGLANEFHPYPKLDIIYELLFGSVRGILVTQPWALASILIFLWLVLKRRFSPASLVSIGGFALLVCANSTFGAWHSGGSAGPRYIAMIFPIIAFSTGLYYDQIPKIFRTFLWIGLIVSLVFRTQVFATTIIPPIVPLWTWQWNEIINSQSIKPWLRIFIFILTMLVSTLTILRKEIVIEELKNH